jgi:hypothetical protein
MALRVQGSMFKACPELVERVQGGDGSLNVEPVTLNRAEGVPSLLQACPSLAAREVYCGIRVEAKFSSGAWRAPFKPGFRS